MKNSKNLFLVFVLSFTFITAYAQEECKVMMENIQSSYTGECKNHLAHGKGSARGIDTYTGMFRKGLPNGKGIYNWSTGEYYDGEWLMGKREGVGEYHYFINGKEAIQAGVWKDNKYLGKVTVPPKITLRQNISDVSIIKTGDGNQVVIKMVMSGTNNTSISNLSINVNSGIEVPYGIYIGFKSITFPFVCKLSYTSPNALHTTEYQCALEFEITEPGRWEVKLVNN